MAMGARLGSMVQKGKFAALAKSAVLDTALKRVDFPTFGNPMSPTRGAALSFVLEVLDTSWVVVGQTARGR